MVPPPDQEDRHAPTRYILQTLPPPRPMKTKKILSRCHETEVEWTPEPLSPMMLRKSIRVLGMSVKPKPKPEKKPAKWVKDGYVVPMKWSTQERRARRQWLRDNGEILTAKERNSRFPEQMSA